MNQLMKYSLYVVVAAVCILATGCVHRTVIEEPAFKATTTRSNPARDSGQVVQQQTYWIWQAGFWTSDSQ